MTTKAFADSFAADLREKVIEKSIDWTGNVATEFIEKTFQREMRNQGSQSMSIDELFVDYRERIHKLDKKLKAATVVESNLMQELTRIADLLKEAKNNELRAKNIASEKEDAAEKLQYQFSFSDRTIKELREFLAAA